MNEEPTRGRRVTDKAGDFFNSAVQAVKMERMEGEQRLLQSQVKQSVDNLTSTLHALQADTRNVVSKISDLSGLHSSNEYNKTAIAEIKNKVGDLDKRLGDWFDEFDLRNDRRWAQYETNRDLWRREHEAENENSARDLEKEIRSVRETVIRFMGYGSAAGALAGVIIAGFLWSINYRFEEGKEDLQQTSASVDTNRQLVDGAIKELVDIKLYLARGGRMPEEPYVPQSQRSQNGKQDPGKPAK